MIIASIFLIRVMRRKTMSSKLLSRGSSRAAKGWFGWRRRSQDSATEGPPRQPGNISPTGPHGFPADEKSYSQQQNVDEFLCPVVISKTAIPEAATALLQAETQAQNLAHEEGPENPALVEVFQAPAPKQVTQPISQAFYTSSTYTPNPTYNNTNTTFVPRGMSDAYDQAQMGLNHLSYLSSLSSGFGDAEIIIAESGPTNQIIHAAQQNSRQSRNFSWQPSILQTGRPGGRDMVYTATTVESAPRYRTVNSWVAQQRGHLERQQQSLREVPNS
jgi:hypothetical protein